MSVGKTIEAWARGYVLFRVNDRRFLTYGRALAYKNATVGNVAFDGWHVLKGWRCFFIRTDQPVFEPPEPPDDDSPDYHASAEL
jgi:hypothetical protein